MDSKTKNFFDISELILCIVRKWKFITANAAIALMCAIIYSFVIAEKQYVSSVTFLPPFEDKSIVNLVSSLPIGGLASSSSDLMPQQIITIFNSKSVKRRFVEEFRLYDKYKLLKSPNKFELTLKRLRKDLLLTSEELGSFGVTKQVSFTISYYHTSPDTALLGANYAFGLIDSMIREVGVDKGRRNRIFVESQLKLNKMILDSLQQKFEIFQKDNKIYNIPSQVQLSLSNYGRIRAQIIANELKLKTLMQDFSEDHPSLTTLRKENEVLNKELNKIEGISSPDIFVGLEKSTELLPEYTNFLRNIEVQNKLILLLTQQLEEAKLREARDYSSLKIVDAAFIPEYKAKPKRILLLVSVFGVYMIVVLLLIISLHIITTSIITTRLYNDIIKTIKK